MVWQKKIILKSKIDAWLKISSSLSEIIKQRASYRVDVVNSLKKNLMENELKKFSIFRKEKLFLREVILFANDKPVMYARTVIPRAHLRGFWDELRVLKTNLWVKLFLIIKKYLDHHLLIRNYQLLMIFLKELVPWALILNSLWLRANQHFYIKEKAFY